MSQRGRRRTSAAAAPPLKLERTSDDWIALRGARRAWLRRDDPSGLVW